MFPWSVAIQAALLAAFAVISPYPHLTVKCQEAWKLNEINPEHEAKVDLDTRAVPHLAQKDLPEEWQRELLAHTALSRLGAAKVLSLETEYADNTWEFFRSSAIYEALLNMARISNFQMYSRSVPHAWSMWGLQDSVAAFKRVELSRNKDRSDWYINACKGYPFNPGNTSVLAHAPMAYLMAMKFALDLRGQVTYFDKPFFSIKDIVGAYIKLRDPTGYWLGGQEEGQRILRRKMIDTNPPVCPREVRVAIAFDTTEYPKEALVLLNKLIGEAREFTTHAQITVRGTSAAPGGFKEGAVLNRFPNIQESGDVSMNTLDLVEESIEDITKTEAGNILKARVILIISKFESEGSVNTSRAVSLWDRMQTSSIEPYFVTVDTLKPLPMPVPNYDDFGLLRLINKEAFRGIHSASYESNTMRLIVHRMLRLICQSVVTIPYGEYKKINTFEKTANNIFDRIHLRIAPPIRDMFNRRWYNVSFMCLSPRCDFDVYGHLQRHVNEYFHDTHLKATLSSNEVIKGNFFSSSWIAIKDSARQMDEIKIVANLMLVPAGACTIGVQATADKDDSAMRLRLSEAVDN